MIELADLEKNKILAPIFKRKLAEGLRQGRKQGIEQGLERGIAQGIAQGIEQGRKQGIEQGRVTAQHAMLTKLLNQDRKSTRLNSSHG